MVLHQGGLAVSDQPKSYHLSLVRGRTDLLRIPEDLAADLGGEGGVKGTANTPSGRKWPVTINLRDRTIIGLGLWLKRKPTRAPSLWSFIS